MRVCESFESSFSHVNYYGSYIVAVDFFFVNVIPFMKLGVVACCCLVLFVVVVVVVVAVSYTHLTLPSKRIV